MNNDFKIYKLSDQIDKYNAPNNIPEVSNNQYNKNKVRDDFRNMLINNLYISLLEATDLEIGIFNCTIDYANTNKIQLSWKCSLFLDTYINISRSIYSNLKSNSYIGNKDLYKRMVDNKEFVPHMLPYMQCHNIFPERWKDIIDKMSPKERESHFENRALSYLMKKI